MAFSNEGIKGDLAYIQAHFEKISKTIEKLEASNLTLKSPVQLVEDLRKIIGEVPGPKGRFVSEKFESVPDKNRSYKVLSEVTQVIETETNIKLTGVGSYKFLSITSSDVERNLSYKTILTDREIIDSILLFYEFVTVIFVKLHCKSSIEVKMTVENSDVIWSGSRYETILRF